MEQLLLAHIPLLAAINKQKYYSCVISHYQFVSITQGCTKSFILDKYISPDKTTGSNFKERIGKYWFWESA